jgi:hypothetical protein
MEKYYHYINEIKLYQFKIIKFLFNDLIEFQLSNSLIFLNF